ncbi:MAG: ATP-dependent helicase [Aphanocapsa sp. GSE-SYN-MK-11-07L]|nr:ATP-dependent helicase [Aphanocapsa sp. GSE-SYN-MK-11-07L]
MTCSPIESSLEALRATLRPGQRELADWQSGPLAVSAVPGAGKSHGMAVAAAIAVARHQNTAQSKHQRFPTGQQSRTRQLLVVTFTRSAAANIKGQIRQHLKDLGLPQIGFAVHTLHGLALNIARNSQLSGLNLDQSILISPYQNHRLIRTCVERWIADYPHLYQQLLAGQHFDGEQTEHLRRQSVLRTEILPSLAQTAVREAKSSGLLPEHLWRMAGREELPILEAAAGLYERYQKLLSDRNFIDYDEMILAALRVLSDQSARHWWQSQILAVFEDEAQDSTPLQTQLLTILATDPEQPEQVNLVRVGDSNQAINSTFTPADPFFFRQFCQQCQAQGRLFEMVQAGRSAPVIMAAANFSLDWLNQAGLAGSEQPFRPQTIQPVASTDPQADANPLPVGQGLEIWAPRDVFETVALIGQRLGDLFSANPAATAAILVRENKQGRFMAEVLAEPQRYGLTLDLSQCPFQVYDVGSGDRRSHVPQEMLKLLQFLERPHSPDYLKAALTVLSDRQLIPAQDLNLLVSQPEQFLYPDPLEPTQPEPIRLARQLCTQLLRSRIELPHYELMTFLALTLNYDRAELATTDKLAARLGQQTFEQPSLGAMLPVLQELVGSEQFEAVDVEASQDRYVRPGQLTIITMHKAKGLDWDYVFIPFLNQNMIPGQLRVPPQAQFLGNFTLAEVARAQIRAGLHQQHLADHQAQARPNSLTEIPDIATAWQRAQDLKIAEEFRLLYVAMTRAKRLLWLASAQQAPFSWGSFNWQKRDRLDEKAACPILPPLQQQFPSSIVANQARKSPVSKSVSRTVARSSRSTNE